MSGNPLLRYCGGCGARLARDNPGVWCSPCQQKARDLVRFPPQVPAGFWDTEAMREALASRHMGQVVRAYRHHPSHGTRPLSQELVGGWFGVTQAQLSRVEHGSPVSDLRKLIGWAQVLRIPARCLWFDLPGERRGGLQDEAVVAEGEGNVEAVGQVLTPQHAALVSADRLDDGGVFAGGDAMMVWLVTTIDGRPALVPVRLSRRRVLAAGGASMLGALDGLLDPDELARVTAAIVRPTRADLVTVRHLEALLEHYRRLDDQLGPRGLLTPVQSTLDLVNDLRKAARSDVRQALLSLSAEYEQLTGWLWQDSGDHAAAERAYERAVARATEAGDQAIPGYVLARRAEQALQQGRAETARDLAQAAQAGKGRLTPAVHAYAAMKEARAWALDGKPDACKRKLEEAAVLLAESAANSRAEEPPWIYFLVEEDLTGHRGMCLTDLEEAGPAIDVFDRMIPALPAERIRDRAYYLSWAVKAHVDNHDPEQAAAVARETAHIAIGTGSGDVLQKLRGLHAQLSKAHKDVRAVQEFGELLRSPRVAPGVSATPYE